VYLTCVGTSDVAKLASARPHSTKRNQASESVQRTIRSAAILTIVASGLPITAHSAQKSDAHVTQDVVVRWNVAMLQAIRNTGVAPVVAARALAIVHTCMYDAWAAYDPLAVGTQLGDALRRPVREATPANKRKAISYAAYRALVELFPTQQSVLFNRDMLSLGYDPSDVSSTAAGVGNEACEAVLSFRRADGANQLGDINGGAPYSDYTDYVPVNSVTNVVDPNRWQPLQNLNGNPQSFVAPHWGLVKPFALRAADQFRPPDPPAFGSYEYVQQVEEVVALSAELNDRRKAIALYWADGPHSETPPGHWNLVAQFISKRDRHTLDEDVVMFFALGNAMLDASIAVWDCKRAYDYVRPISAVRYLYSGQTLKAWAGPGNGTQLITGDMFQSYIPTPPFPEYTSGHSAFSASAAEVLRRFTGSDFFGASYTVRAGSSIVEPAVAPSRDVTLSWTTFSEAANQAAISRRYGGIHFKDGDVASRKMGRKIGTAVSKKVLTYLNGTVAGRAASGVSAQVQ
jgi:hypothetical protein